MKNDNWLKTQLPNLPENVALVRLIIASFASQLDFTIPEVDEIKVAVSEAVSNAVVHAYPNQPGIIEIEAELKNESIRIIISDKGIGIQDIDQALQPSFSTDEDRLGLGLVFINSLMDETKIYSKPGEGTTIEMIKKVTIKPEVQVG